MNNVTGPETKAFKLTDELSQALIEEVRDLLNEVDSGNAILLNVGVRHISSFGGDERKVFELDILKIGDSND